MNRKTMIVLPVFAGTAAAAVGFTVTRDDVAPPQSRSESIADSLIENWISAVGGLESYRTLRSARYTLTTEIYDTESGRLRRTRPRYVTIARTPMGELSRIDRWEGDDLIRQGWDGSTEWATMNGQDLGPGDMDFDQVRYVSGDVNYWISLPFKLHDDGVNLHDRGRDEDGRYVVGVSFGEGIGLHDGDAWQYWFEDGQSWPVQIAYMEEGRANWSLLRFEDIRTVDGYVFVGRRVHYNGLGQLTKVLYTQDFEFNPSLAGSVFARP